MADCLFCKIARGEAGTRFIYEDELIAAFHDISPQAPLHALIIPKRHTESAAVLTEDDGELLGRVFSVAARLAAEAGYTNGYRVVTNVGADGAQSVAHLHFHLLAGRQMAWPPG